MSSMAAASMRMFVATLLVVMLAVCGAQAVTDVYDLIPGRCPTCKALPPLIANLTDVPGGRAFLDDLGKEITKRTGIPVPEWLLDLAVENADALMNYVQFTVWDLSEGSAFLNLEYRLGLINQTKPDTDAVPNGFDLADLATFPINMTKYLPVEDPVQVLPNLWRAFTRTNVPVKTIQQEVVLGLVMNQLSSNAHLPVGHPATFHCKYNGATITSVRGLLQALADNDHSFTSHLTWRAVDFFGYRTKDDKGNWYEVPAPVFVNIGVKDPATGHHLVVPTIHDEFVISITAGPNATGTTFSGNMLWYEGDTGIGFFAGDIYGLGAWVGTANGEFLSGADTIEYAHYMSLYGDALLTAAADDNLYDYGYGMSGVCVDSTGIIEYIKYGNFTLYPLMLDKDYIAPTLKQLASLNNDYAADYERILAAVDALEPDYRPNPSIPARVLNSLPWKAGEEPFQAAVDARRVLSTM